MVLAARIGPGGERVLAQYGILALENRDTVEKALGKLARFYRKQAGRSALLPAQA
ncbi:hypothetical protein D3C81_2113380 [compost metagenome]